MPRSIRTAVAATVSQTTRRQIILGLTDADVQLEHMDTDGTSAMHSLSAYRPDLLIVDSVLPGTDGLTLAKRVLCGFEFPVRPAVLLLHDACYPLPEADILHSLGAVSLETPFSSNDFQTAVNRLRTEEIHFSDKETALADCLLDTLGVPIHPGRECLKLAVLFCAADQRLMHSLSTQLYPKIGASCGFDARKAERAIRHVIDLAWKSDKFDNQYRIFADTVDAGRGQPTCREMITRLADILRSEG